MRAAPLAFHSDHPTAPPPKRGPPQPDLPRYSIPVPKGARPRMFLEIFAGCARLSGAIHGSSLHVAPPIELTLGTWFDLSRVRVMAAVLSLIRSGRVWLTHLAPPCAAFSLAPDEKKRKRLLKSGMCTARCAMRILRVCQEHNVAWTLENPRGSRIFHWGPLHRFMLRHECICVYVDYCMFGMHYMKPTLFVSNRQERKAMFGRTFS